MSTQLKFPKVMVVIVGRQMKIMMIIEEISFVTTFWFLRMSLNAPQKRATRAMPIKGKKQASVIFMKAGWIVMPLSLTKQSMESTMPLD